jgi:signal transduction histidine kinase
MDNSFMKTAQLPFLLLLSVFVAFIIAMMVVIPTLNPPDEDINQLFLFMSGSGIATTGMVYFLYRQGMIQWFSSIRWTLLTIIVLTIALIFVNVWLTARLMFINYHDLVLTSALLVFAGFVSAVSVFIISSTLIDRIHDLCLAAERLARGNLDTRIVVSGNDELAELASTFNTMADALQTVDVEKRMLEQTRRDLIAWVSHDLRTPLAAIRAMNEAIIDGVVNDDDTITRYNGNIQKEVQHLSRLIDDLFELSKLDTGRVTIDRQITSLRDLVSDTLGSMGAKAKLHNIMLNGKVETGVDMASIAPDKIQRVLYNLLDNAIEHTPRNGKIDLYIQRSQNDIRISVYNTGSKVKPQDLPHIFESFYRGEASRAQSKGNRGTGLGLAIARGFVEAHGGKIWAESGPNDGVTFIFSLPLT